MLRAKLQSHDFHATLILISFIVHYYVSQARYKEILGSKEVWSIWGWTEWHSMPASSHLRVSFSNTAVQQLAQPPDAYQLPFTSTLNLNRQLLTFFFFFWSSPSEIQTTAKTNLLLIVISRPPFLQNCRIIAQVNCKLAFSLGMGPSTTPPSCRIPCISSIKHRLKSWKTKEETRPSLYVVAAHTGLP